MMPIEPSKYDNSNSSSSEPDNSTSTSQDEMYRQIVEEYGYDTETGVYGKGYSNDNGKTFVVQDTCYGRKFRQQDADNLWELLKPMVEALIKEDEGEKTDGTD